MTDTKADGTLNDQTPQEWADALAQTVGAIFLHNHPDGKDWAVPK